MKRRDFLIGSAGGALALASAPLSAAQRRAEATAWEIGPIIRRRNYSVGMPLHPQIDGQGWNFDFPGPRQRDGHVHYVTRATGSLRDARGIRLRYRVDAQRQARFVPQENPDLPGAISLYIQRAGDDWLARGDGAFARWYSPNSRLQEITPGEHELTVMFDENWISVMGSNRERHPREFVETLVRAGRIGLTFGSRQSRGHGVYSTAPARFTLLEFAVL
ncbi:hypothetical protein [Aurantiacibacter marinus]|uniref:Uncharacterized protein n=1 Tax=Aurantiacibacter marinus TaxID=874156 RepID=A0A0H0XL23_9SPHN|nr:hypothetical protein [Aurantiacibacter marinus]KLI63044.1 hypothetical protein AAV99_12835 [Aurantiacibacter marinus]